jgi:DUF4097 and DUF4098 domain-containing protein YvlB
MTKRLAAVVFASLLVPALLHAKIEGHFDRTLQVSGAVSLDVTTGSGDITVKTGSSNQVIVHGTVHGNISFFNSDNAVHLVEANPPVEQNGSSIRLGYNLPEDAKHHVSIDYQITVPADTSVQAHSGSGNIQVMGVRSDVQVHTGSGDIRVNDIAHGLQAHTGSGSIHAQNVASPFQAQTGSGDIEASLTGSGDVDAHTGSGSIRLTGINGGARARTGSGRIEAGGSNVGGGWELHSGSGSIRLALGSSSKFNLDAHTSSGSIHSDVPITMQGSLTKNELKGTVNGGGPTVAVSTGSGDIDIR